MDPLTGTGDSIAPASPLDPALDLLFARHSADMQAQTPPESVYMLPREALSAPCIAFYVLRGADGAPKAMAALKQGGAVGGMRWGEIKSMHVLSECRGQGLSRRLLSHLIGTARAAGLHCLNLETGREPIFAPARALYARMGFTPCGPFGDYRDDPNSLFMTLPLTAPAEPALAPAATPVQNPSGLAP